MGTFSKMADVPGFGRSGVRTEPGTYEVEVTDLHLRHSTDPAKEGIIYAVFEWTFLKSTNDAHKPGSSGSTSPKIRPDAWGFAANDVIRFVYAAVKAKGLEIPAPELFELAKTVATAIADVDANERAAAAAKLKALEIEDAADFIRGERVALEAVLGKTKKGEPFTYLNWSPVAA